MGRAQEARQKTRANKPGVVERNTPNAARAFLNDFGRALLSASPIAPIVGAFTPAAAEARKDQSGFFPELGISEGMSSLRPSNEFLPAFAKGLISAVPGLNIGAAMLTPQAAEARRDQSGFWPELGISEGLSALNPLSGYQNQSFKSVGENVGQAGAEALAQAGPPDFINKGKDQWGRSASYQTDDGTWVNRSNVFTPHYETGEPLGVMGRSQRRAYDLAASKAGF